MKEEQKELDVVLSGEEFRYLLLEVTDLNRIDSIVNDEKYKDCPEDIVWMIRKSLEMRADAPERFKKLGKGKK